VDDTRSAGASLSRLSAESETAAARAARDPPRARHESERREPCL